MHPLHDYVAKRLADLIKSRRVVVWYDERSEFAPFVDELRGGPRASDKAVLVKLNGTRVRLAEYVGSMFELRAAVEPYVSGDSPDAVVVYLPGCAHEAQTSVLMELEKAGTTWPHQLVRLAKELLLQRYTLGVVDAMLSADRTLAYIDLARLAGSDEPEPPSVLRAIFHHIRGNDALLAAWITDDSRDVDINGKAATPELVALIGAWLGLELPDHAALSKLRAITLRYVLASEFRSDLSCPPPATLDGVPTPPSPEAEAAVRVLAKCLRTNHPQVYPSLADQVENELALADATLPAGALGSIDTFRFEERELLRHCGDLIGESRFAEALTVVAQREHSFWLDLDVQRKFQWEATRGMAELGELATQVRVAVSKTDDDVRVWLDRYTAAEGWYRLDQAQRRLETLIPNLFDHPEERPLGVVRRAYEDTCHLMAQGFTKALASSGWTIPAALHQTRIYSEVVSTQPKPVAYIFVDAMRFEMGVELAGRLPTTSEVSVRPGVGALPSITPIGMAALHPSASATFSVVEQGGKLGALIDDVFLPDLTARKKFANARIPGLVDVALNDLLELPASTISKRLDGATVVVVRSQEIDHAGEAGFSFQARRVMDTVIDNLALAMHKLAAAGVEQAVVTADHGHLFFASDRDESMRTDAPGGHTVDLHRRCWIGRGGATPPGCVRVSAAALGYASDLEFVFPAGSGVFRAGGDLAFHHGGPSLQELVIPVLTVRTKVNLAARPSAGPIAARGLPGAVTNRIFSVALTLGDQQPILGATGMLVRPLLVSEGKQVGAVGMAVDAEFVRSTGCVRLEPETPVTVAFLLNDESVQSLRVVVQDPATDAELYRSPADIPVQLGVQ